MENKHILAIILVALLSGFCLLVVASSGSILWLLAGQPATLTPTATLLPAPVSFATPEPTATSTVSPPTFTPLPTLPPTKTPTPVIPSPTPTATPWPIAAPPTEPALSETEVTPPPPPPPPTATPLPTQTPAPVFSFEAVEVDAFPTNHLDFDVYIAVTDANNTPLSGYKVMGLHSSGMQVESGLSAGDWTENSGAMYYKAGNIKYQVVNSPGGAWQLQLVDGAGVAVASPLDFPFAQDDLKWYFVLYRRVN